MLDWISHGPHLFMLARIGSAAVVVDGPSHDAGDVMPFSPKCRPLLTVRHVLHQRYQAVRRSRWWGMVLVGVLGVVSVRLVPYVMPIRATDLAQVDEAVTFRDRHGQPLGTLLSVSQDHTMVVPLEQISPVFIQAILAAEDGRYYAHGPLDLVAAVRAAKDSAQAGSIVSGASTITMQLARMIHPSPRTIGGKVQEVWTAWRLAAGMHRDEILAAYVNRIPMGSNIYGVEAAAQAYFGVAAADLTVAQASILAALPNNPTYLNPYDYWPGLKRRQRYVLGQMVADGWLTQDEGDRAFQVEVTVQPRQQGILAAPHFLFWVAEALPEDHPADIRTTLDGALQQFVQTQARQVVRSLADQNVQQAAAVVVDNHTGEVLAYVGSVDYFSDGDWGRNDGVQALRQPGSTLKPFLYALALEQGAIKPNTILADVPTYYAIPGARLYSPTDYDETFQGPVRVRLALANSLNVPAVRVLEKVGVPAFLRRLQQLGFRHLTQDPEYYGLGLALGSGEVSLWELTHAYLTLAHQGQSRPLRTMGTALSPGGADDGVGDADTWALVMQMLGDRHARARSFGVDSVLSLPFDAAVKTGTSSNFRDTWTVGFTTDYTVATWVGNFEGDPMQHVSGVQGAAPLWNRIMLHLHPDHDPAPLPEPTTLARRPICALSGLKPTPACPMVVEEYLYPADMRTYDQQVDTTYQAVADPSGRERSYRLNLPEVYDPWLAQQPDLAAPLGQLSILTPQNGDVFAAPGDADVDAGIRAEPDAGLRLEFKAAGGTGDAVEWWLNGDRLSPAPAAPPAAPPSSTTASYFWPLQPGRWTLEARTATERDRVEFEVVNTERPGGARGFSAGPAGE